MILLIFTLIILMLTFVGLAQEKVEHFCGVLSEEEIVAMTSNSFNLPNSFIENEIQGQCNLLVSVNPYIWDENKITQSGNLGGHSFFDSIETPPQLYMGAREKRVLDIEKTLENHGINVDFGSNVGYGTYLDEEPYDANFYYIHKSANPYLKYTYNKYQTQQEITYASVACSSKVYLNKLNNGVLTKKEFEINKGVIKIILSWVGNFEIPENIYVGNCVELESQINNEAAITYNDLKISCPNCIFDEKRPEKNNFLNLEFKDKGFNVLKGQKVEVSSNEVSSSVFASSGDIILTADDFFEPKYKDNYVQFTSSGINFGGSGEIHPNSPFVSKNKEEIIIFNGFSGSTYSSQDRFVINDLSSLDYSSSPQRSVKIQRPDGSYQIITPQRGELRSVYYTYDDQIFAYEGQPESAKFTFSNEYNQMVFLSTKEKNQYKVVYNGKSYLVAYKEREIYPEG